MRYRLICEGVRGGTERALPTVLRTADIGAGVSHDGDGIGIFATARLGPVRHLDPDDPLRDEWTVVVISPHDAAALVAKDVGAGAGADVSEGCICRLAS